MSELPNKDFSITFIQVVSALAVVTLHTNGCFWQFSATENYWFTANIIESVFYFAVPLFFMITGITLLDYQDRYSTKKYFKKRIEKTVIPYVAWSIIGVIFLFFTHRITADDFSVKWIINGLLSTSGIIDLYWFFQPLFCTYLAIPLFASIDKNKKKSTAEYLIIVALIVNILIPFLNSTMDLGLSWVLWIDVVSGYLFWVVAGYYIHKYPPKRKQKIPIVVLSIIGLLLHVVGTYVLSTKSGEIVSTYKGYTNLPCVLYTIGVYVILVDVAHKIEKIKRLRKIFEVVRKYTFSLYLMQWFVLRTIDMFPDINQRSLKYRLFAPCVITAIVICCTWILRKIPVVRKIVP